MDYKNEDIGGFSLMRSRSFHIQTQQLEFHDRNRTILLLSEMGRDLYYMHQIDIREFFAGERPINICCREIATCAQDYFFELRRK